MDALLFKGEWCTKGGTLDLVDEIKEVAKKIAPDWPQHTITRTNWCESNCRFVTPYENPVCCYGGEKKPVFDLGGEIEGFEGVFELSYCKGVKAVISPRSAPIPKDPGRKLFKLDGFEEVSPKPKPTVSAGTKSTDTKKSPKKSSKKSKPKPPAAEGGAE